MEADMAKTPQHRTLAETAFGLGHHNPLARMMAGFTGFAVAATLILATTIPVEARRGICAIELEAPTSSCTTQ
jgi:hypothetical protein